MCLLPLCTDLLRDYSTDKVDDFTALYGLRYQLYNALNSLSVGHAMYVRYDMSSLTFKRPQDLEDFYYRLKYVSTWHEDKDNLISFIVPGTGFAQSIGKILIKHDWCLPTNIEHWVPNIKVYSLSDTGRLAFSSALIWWDSLTFSEKIKAAVVE